MKSKVDNADYTNMLTQSAGSKVYALDNYDNSWKLVSADVQTWKKNWDNYRVYNSSQDKFVDANSDLPQVWRKYETLAWKSLVNPEGTIPTTGPEAFVG